MNYIKPFFFILLTGFLPLVQVHAQQQDCAAGSTATPILLETFGSGTNPGPALAPGITNYTYTSGWPTDGWYTISNTSNPDSGGNPFWHTKPDHTGNVNGYMMVVNAALTQGEFYRKRITGLCQSTPFVCTVWAANVNNPDLVNLCGATCDYADILIKIESTSGVIINSITTGNLPIEPTLVWRQYNLLFSPLAGQNTVDLVFVNNRSGGNGNDLVLDDIAFKICLPNVTLTGPAMVCSGQNATITGTWNVGFVNPEMQWQVSSGGGPWTDIPGAKSQDLVINNVSLPPPVFKYRLLVAENGNVTSPHCRVISNEATLNIVPSLFANVTNVTAATCGSNSGSASVNLTGGTPGYTYLWVPGGQTSPSISGLASGVYSVTVTDKNGCPDTDVATIIKADGPLVSASVDSHVSCHNENTGVAHVAAIGGTAPLSYLWAPSAQSTTTATGLSSGNYTVTVADANNCTVSQILTITQPVSSLTSSMSVSGFSCDGTSPNAIATTTAGGGTPPYSYLWKPGNRTTPSISNLTAGIYSVTITDSKGCSFSQTATVVSSTKPDAKFSTEPVISCKGVMMRFRDESSPSSISSWNWNFGDGQTSTDQHPSHPYAYEAGTYNVTLIVSNPPCKDTVKSTIKIRDMFSYASFKPANIFTPNGDDVNDCFIPALAGKGADTLTECVSLVVFDRWGIKMFESSEHDKCWNGNNKNDSKPAVDGVYFYISTLGEFTLKGYVTLVRNKPE